MYSHKPGQPTFLVVFFFLLSSLQFPQLSLSEGIQERDNISPGSSPQAPATGFRQKGKMLCTPAHTSPSQSIPKRVKQPPPAHHCWLLPSLPSTLLIICYLQAVLRPCPHPPHVHAHPFFFVQLLPSPCPASGTVPFPYRPPIVPAVNDGSVPTTVTQRKIQSLLHRGKAQARLPDDRCPALNTCILLAKYYRLAR